MANFSGVERDLVIGTSRHRQALVLPYFSLPPLTDLAGLSESALIHRCPRCRRAGRHTLSEVAAPGRYGGRAGVLLASASPVIQAEGKTVAVLGSVREISRWIEGTNPSVRVQESDLDDASALTASTSLVHSLYRNPDRAATSTLQSGALGLIRNPLLILDERGWVIDANQAYCELTGSDCGVLQQRGSFLSCVAPKDRRSLAGALQDEEHGKSFRIKVLTSSGRRPGLLCLSPVSRKEGGQGGFLPSFSKTFLQEGSDAWVRGR
jgi:PAS domain-containing protein